LIAENDLADFSDYLIPPVHRKVQAAAFTYERKNWTVIDESIADDLEYLMTVNDGDLEIASRSLDDRVWIAVYLQDDGPAIWNGEERCKRICWMRLTGRFNRESPIPAG